MHTTKLIIPKVYLHVAKGKRFARRIALLHGINLCPHKYLRLCCWFQKGEYFVHCACTSTLLQDLHTLHYIFSVVQTHIIIIGSAINTGKKACRYGLSRDRTAAVRTRIHTVHALFKSKVRLPKHTQIELLY